MDYEYGLYKLNKIQKENAQHCPSADIQAKASALSKCLNKFTCILSKLQ